MRRAGAVSLCACTVNQQLTDNTPWVVPSRAVCPRYAGYLAAALKELMADDYYYAKMKEDCASDQSALEALCAVIGPLEDGSLESLGADGSLNADLLRRCVFLCVCGTCTAWVLTMTHVSAADATAATLTRLTTHEGQPGMFTLLAAFGAEHGEQKLLAASSTCASCELHPSRSISIHKHLHSSSMGVGDDN